MNDETVKMPEDSPQNAAVSEWLDTLDEQETRIALDDLEFMHGSHGPRFSRHVAFYTDDDDGRLVTSWFWYNDAEDTVTLRASGGRVVFGPVPWDCLRDMLEGSLVGWRCRREAMQHAANAPVPAAKAAGMDAAEAWAKSLTWIDASSTLNALDSGIRRGSIGDRISFAVSVSDDGCRMVDVFAGGEPRFKVAFELLRECLMERLCGPGPDEDGRPGASRGDRVVQKPGSRVFDAGVVPC